MNIELQYKVNEKLNRQHKKCNACDTVNDLIYYCDIENDISHMTTLCRRCFEIGENGKSEWILKAKKGNILSINSARQAFIKRSLKNLDRVSNMKSLF